MKKYIIASLIDGVQHYFTGGISKQLPLFHKDISLAYRYESRDTAESRMYRLTGVSEYLKVIEE